MLSMIADIDLRIADESRPDLRDLFQFLVIDTGQVLARDRIAVSAIRTEHPHLLDCFALSFKTDAVHIVLSSATAPITALEDFARRAGFLIHETMAVVPPLHMTRPKRRPTVV